MGGDHRRRVLTDERRNGASLGLYGLSDNGRAVVGGLNNVIEARWPSCEIGRCVLADKRCWIGGRILSWLPYSADRYRRRLRVVFENVLGGHRINVGFARSVNGSGLHWSRFVCVWRGGRNRTNG